jgi:hypothetical protein
VQLDPPIADWGIHEVDLVHRFPHNIGGAAEQPSRALNRA